MCTGMMAMTQVSNVVYVQEDPEYGGAPEALKMITFPRQFNTYTPIGLPQKIALEQGKALGIVSFNTNNLKILDYWYSTLAEKNIEIIDANSLFARGS